jgi:hypothetical protein
LYKSLNHKTLTHVEVIALPIAGPYSHIAIGAVSRHIDPCKCRDRYTWHVSAVSFINKESIVKRTAVKTVTNICRETGDLVILDAPSIPVVLPFTKKLLLVLVLARIDRSELSSP